jgi:flagellar hook-associated protein 1 FlgK
MGSLQGILDIAAQALETNQGAIQITTNNIANSNTPGYYREEAILQSGPVVPLGNGTLQLQEGVDLTGVQGIFNQVVENGLQQATQQQGQLNAYIDSFNQVQNLFNEAQGAGLQQPLANFFNSFQSLSTDPTDTSLRAAVISAGQTLAAA